MNNIEYLQFIKGVTKEQKTYWVLYIDLKILLKNKFEIENNYYNIADTKKYFLRFNNDLR